MNKPYTTDAFYKRIINSSKQYICTALYGMCIVQYSSLNAKALRYGMC